MGKTATLKPQRALGCTCGREARLDHGIPMEDSPRLVDISGYLSQPSEAEIECARLFRPHEQLVIFDIGACEGEDSIRYARHYPRSRVFAFEPLPANQALVRANLERYAARNATLYPVALSDRAGDATFHVSSGRPRDLFAGENWNYGNKSSSLLPPAQNEPMHGWIEFKESITVRTETLDEFCRTHAIARIDFIHMDVQGAEHLVLNGAQTMLPRVTAIWLEVSECALYRCQKTRPEIEDLMHRHRFALGFELRREIEGDQLFLNTRHLRPWGYFAGSYARAMLRRARSVAGRAKHALHR